MPNPWPPKCCSRFLHLSSYSSPSFLVPLSGLLRIEINRGIDSRTSLTKSFTPCFRRSRTLTRSLQTVFSERLHYVSDLTPKMRFFLEAASDRRKQVGRIRAILLCSHSSNMTAGPSRNRPCGRTHRPDTDFCVHSHSSFATVHRTPQIREDIQVLNGFALISTVR